MTAAQDWLCSSKPNPRKFDPKGPNKSRSHPAGQARHQALLLRPSHPAGTALGMHCLVTAAAGTQGSFWHRSQSRERQLSQGNDWVRSHPAGHQALLLRPRHPAGAAPGLIGCLSTAALKEKCSCSHISPRLGTKAQSSSNQTAGSEATLLGIKPLLRGLVMQQAPFVGLDGSMMLAGPEMMKGARAKTNCSGTPFRL